ncbi:methyltransferase-like protein [Gossypium australe]|uniref:Methyltransferase-like protein n=1 Tax=Gossypium australe TaxID=47621 RepID=A0A5B6VT68_9ROSI|nr:methyltransferase-like protein [Gossypium australe]
MCPMRFLLVFFSAILAGYFAWRTAVGSSVDADDGVSEDSRKIVAKNEQDFSFKMMVKNGFWVFVDMASGRYLWRNFKELKNDEKSKSS